MALSVETERVLQALVASTRQQIAASVAAEDYEAALRRFAAILKTSTRDADREKVRDRARMVALQGGRCAVCSVSFADSAPATRGVTNRLLCGPCSRESRIPPPPR